MKKYLPLISLLFLFPLFSDAGAISGEDLIADTSIEQIVVFRDGAQVTRQAAVTLSPGRNEILFSGLARSLNSQTIQLTGNGNFMILSLSHRQDYLQEHPQKKRLQQLATRRDSLERLIEEKETTRSIIDRELGILLSNTNLKGNQQNLSATELKQAMEYIHQKLTDLETQKLDLNRELAELQEKLAKFNKQISELDNSSRQNSSSVTAVLQSEAAGQVELTLTYTVSGAGWYPSYDIRAGDIDSPMNLSYKANVHQSTGVDWNNVRLTVSSAIPDPGGVLPQLTPWYLRFYTAKREGLNLDAEMNLEEMTATAAGQSRSRQVSVREIQNQTSFSYQMELPYDVPSGGKPLTVEINNNEMAADYRYYTVPKLRGQSFLTARVSNWDRYNLLPGDASLFFENTYVGRSEIDPRSVGDTLTFSLGRDESVVTERKKLREFEKKNFFGNKVRESFIWEISVRNSKDKPVRIRVEDQVPVSQHEDIAVSLNESSGAEYNQQNGMLSWQLQIPPGETEVLRFEYEVEYPRGKQVNF